ncbi:hypothetical protein C8T65DRAFT_86191 [Cerioporus squamosus]|nr:hypothetical protein C8T65DRAFT_86191 [Cerioporus squamosus]
MSWRRRHVSGFLTRLLSVRRVGARAAQTLHTKTLSSRFQPSRPISAGLLCARWTPALVNLRAVDQHEQDGGSKSRLDHCLPPPRRRDGSRRSAMTKLHACNFPT